jgi:hypothetical protein
MSRKTCVINLVAGPSAGKTTVAAYLFYKMKTLGLSVEYVQEFAKSLVWLNEFDTLNDQYFVSTEQCRLLRPLVGLVDFIITDGSLLHGLYYNRFNPDNTSNIDKTEAKIISMFNEFENITIFVERGSYRYETDGRYQTEEFAIQIDTVLKHLLKQNQIEFKSFSAETPDEILNAILTRNVGSQIQQKEV